MIALLFISPNLKSSERLPLLPGRSFWPRSGQHIDFSQKVSYKGIASHCPACRDRLNGAQRVLDLFLAERDLFLKNVIQSDYGRFTMEFSDHARTRILQHLCKRFGSNDLFIEDRKRFLRIFYSQIGKILSETLTVPNGVMFGSTNKEFDIALPFILKGIKAYSDYFNENSYFCYWNKKTSDGGFPIVRTFSDVNKLRSRNFVYVKSVFDEIGTVLANLSDLLTWSIPCKPDQIIVVSLAISPEERDLVSSNFEHNIEYINFVDKFAIDFRPEMIGVDDNHVPKLVKNS